MSPRFGSGGANFGFTAFSRKVFVSRSSPVYEIMLSGYEEAHGVRMGSKKGQAGTVYRIVAGSALGDGYASAFDGMHVQRAEGRTVLTGEAEDLYGVLKRINDLGLELLSVQVISPDVR